MKSVVYSVAFVLFLHALLYDMSKCSNIYKKYI